MKITIEGEPKEFAALVLAVQERQGIEFAGDVASLAKSIHDTLQEAQARK